MNQQIVLNFDATGFEGFDDIVEFFAYCTRSLKDEHGRPVQQKYQAADMEYSPAQWSQKVNESNNTTPTMRDGIKYMLCFRDRRWLDYAEWLWLESNTDNVAELERMQQQIQQRIDLAKAKKDNVRPLSRA